MAATLDEKKCEGTRDPWWFIFDPRGLAARAMNYETATTQACLSVWGPFFSREAAHRVLESQRHNLSPHAIVWCGSAHMSPDYRSLVNMARTEALFETDDPHPSL
jgi:hypothetical protein